MSISEAIPVSTAVVTGIALLWYLESAVKNYLRFRRAQKDREDE